MQFDGKDNYHQVSEWKGKTTVPREQDKQQVRLSCHALLPHAHHSCHTRHSPATCAPLSSAATCVRLSCHARQALRVMEAGLEAKCRALRNIAERAEWCASQFDAAKRVDRRIQKEYAAELAKLEQCLAAAVSGIGRVDWKLETMHGKN
eukprot:2701058-Prymnesium_polylepis.1